MSEVPLVGGGGRRKSCEVVRHFRALSAVARRFGVLSEFIRRIGALLVCPTHRGVVGSHPTLPSVVGACPTDRCRSADRSEGSVPDEQLFLFCFPRASVTLLVVLSLCFSSSC